MRQKNAEAREKFLHTLEWLLAVTKRYSGSLQFGLAMISHVDPKLLGETYGAKKAVQQLDEGLYSLRKAFRTTDLVARDGLDFWILIPFPSADEKISDKIKYILESASLAGLQIVERDISIFLLPMNDASVSENITPLQFLAHLKANQATLAHREVTLPASA